MKAVVYRRYGGPEFLEYTDVPDPKLSQTSVLVRVRA
jgi:NADPH:quinone reductase-like Zn-dependent oxidoreductase